MGEPLTGEQARVRALLESEARRLEGATSAEAVLGLEAEATAEEASAAFEAAVQRLELRSPAARHPAIVDLAVRVRARLEDALDDLSMEVDEGTLRGLGDPNAADASGPIPSRPASVPGRTRRSRRSTATQVRSKPASPAAERPTAARISGTHSTPSAPVDLKLSYRAPTAEPARAPRQSSVEGASRTAETPVPKKKGVVAGLLDKLRRSRS